MRTGTTVGSKSTLVMTVEVDVPAGLTLAIKECIAMALEKYGEARVVKVEEKLSFGPSIVREFA